MKHTRMYICILILIVSCFFCIGVSAENGGFAPGSTDVFYVSNTSGADTNEGTSAAAPLKTLGKAYSRMTAGGTIVICGEVKIASGFAPADAGGTVVYTSVRGTTDYRESGAKLVISGNMAFANDTVFERMNLRIEKSGLVFSGRFHSLSFGTGVAVTNGTGLSDFKYPSVIGGYNNPATLAAGSSAADFTVCIRSGTWHDVMGGNRRTVKTSAFGKLSGDVTVRISGGTFNGEVSASGMNVHTGRVYLGTAGSPVFENKVYAFRNYGTLPAASLTTTAKYSGNMMVHLAGGKFEDGFRLAKNTVGAVGGTAGAPQIYSTATVAVKGGSFGGNVEGGGTLGATLLKYKPAVLSADKVVGFPVYRTGSQSFSESATEHVRFDNKVLEHRPDPYVVERGGVYYFCYVGGGGIRIAASGSVPLGGMSTQARTVFTPQMTDIENAKHNYWAPELHYIEASDFGAKYAGWYIYFCADSGIKENPDHRMFVLRATEPDNALSNYEMVGEIRTDGDRWAIDGTILRITSGSYKGVYCIWSGWEGTDNVAQNLYIQKMTSPSAVTGSRVLLSAPEYDWEKRGSGGRLPTINEGPQILQNGGVTHLIYSASGSWCRYYCYGALTLKKGANPLVKANWYKSTTPVFESGNGMYGPGHGSFVKDANGEWWMYYHANNTLDIAANSSWWKQRNMYVKKFDFTTKTLFGASYSYPNFGTPASDGGQQKGYVKTAHHHASGNHQYSPLTLKVAGGYIKLVKSCCLCGAETVVKRVATPTVTAASNPEGGITLTITPTVSGATGYKIFRAAGGGYTQIATTKSTTYTDTTCKLGTTYTYKVKAYLDKAYNNTANGTLTSFASEATEEVKAIPPSVKMTSLYYDGNEVGLRWTASATAKQYKLFRKTGSGAWETLAFVKDPAVTSYTDTTAAAGKTYTYAVQDWTKVGDVYCYSAIGPVVQTITTKQPAAPTLRVDNDANGLLLTVTAVDGAYGYKFYRSTDGTSFKPLKVTRETSYADTAVEIGTTYFYKARAYTKSGVVIVYGVHSAAVSKPAPAPAIPIKSIAYTDGAVRFSWNAAQTVTKYKLFRKLPSEKTWETLGYTTETSFADETAVRGTTYVYAVQNCTKVDGTWYYSLIGPVMKTFAVPQ